jgi:hypothetical protein
MTYILDIILLSTPKFIQPTLKFPIQLVKRPIKNGFTRFKNIHLSRH